MLKKNNKLHTFELYNIYIGNSNNIILSYLLINVQIYSEISVNKH